MNQFLSIPVPLRYNVCIFSIIVPIYFGFIALQIIHFCIIVPYLYRLHCVIQCIHFLYYSPVSIPASLRYTVYTFSVLQSRIYCGSLRDAVCIYFYCIICCVCWSLASHVLTTRTERHATSIHARCRSSGLGGEHSYFTGSVGVMFKSTYIFCS